MASKIKEKILDELMEMYSLTDSETKQGLLNSLAESIDKQDDDRNIRNILWANRDLTTRMFTGPDFQIMPSVGEIMMSNPPSDNLDYEKEFGKDWYTADIPLSKIQFLADKNGLDWKQVSQDMANKATAIQRDDIAHGRWDSSLPTSENLMREASGTLLTLFGRRQQEAIARGEDPTVNDYAGDIAENSMYAVPWGRALGAANTVAKAAAKGSKVAKVGSKVARALTGPVAQYVAGNVTAPLLSEVYDAAAYDDENPRGQFSIGDVLTGVGTNMAAPVMLQRFGGRLNRYIPIAKHMNEGGMITAKSKGQIAAEMAKTQTAQSRAQRAHTKVQRAIEGKHYPKLISETERQLSAGFNADDKKLYDAVLKKIRKGEMLNDAEWKYAHSGAHPELKDFYNLQYNPKQIPTGASLAAEESFKNLFTNEVPNVIGDESLPWYTRIPGGSLYYEYAKEQEEEEKQRQKEQAIEDKWKIRFGVE